MESSFFSEYIKKFEDLKTVFDSLPEGIVAILDKDMNIATANKAISQLLQLPLNDIIGKKAPLVIDKMIPGLLDIIKETAKIKKGIRNYHIETTSPLGKLNSYLVSTAIIKERGDLETAIVLILHDISEITRLRKIASQVDRYGETIGISDSMKNIFALIETLKNYDSSIIISGETGTGKELIARTIHNASNRKNKPFVPVNCSALPYDLIESELFGYVKGAFTGATSNHIGRFTVADGGTLFLDEIGTLSVDTQVKLLRFLQEKIVEPLGSTKKIPVDVRVLSATNRDLWELVSVGEFREDLLYRLKVFQIDLPPLRDRKEDIPLLTSFFLNRLNRYYKKNIAGVSPRVNNRMMKYAWPGNIRELENAMEHAFVLANGPLLELEHLPPELRHADENGAPPPPPDRNLSIEEENIKRALLASNGSINKAADMLGMHRATLWRKSREFRLGKGFGKLQR